MNLSMRDKKILLMFLGVLLFALSFLFVYKPQMEEAAQISANNDSLQERLSQLLELAQNREQYVNDTETMQAEIDEYCKQFPYTVRSEDGIVLALSLIHISTVCQYYPGRCSYEGSPADVKRADRE